MLLMPACYSTYRTVLKVEHCHSAYHTAQFYVMLLFYSAFTTRTTTPPLRCSDGCDLTSYEGGLRMYEFRQCALSAFKLQFLPNTGSERVLHVYDEGLLLCMTY